MYYLAHTLIDQLPWFRCLQGLLLAVQLMLDTMASDHANGMNEMCVCKGGGEGWDPGTIKCWSPQHHCYPASPVSNGERKEHSSCEVILVLQ